MSYTVETVESISFKKLRKILYAALLDNSDRNVRHILKSTIGVKSLVSKKVRLQMYANEDDDPLFLCDVTLTSQDGWLFSLKFIIRRESSGRMLSVLGLLALVCGTGKLVKIDGGEPEPIYSALHRISGRLIKRVDDTTM